MRSDVSTLQARDRFNPSCRTPSGQLYERNNAFFLLFLVSVSGWEEQKVWQENGVCTKTREDYSGPCSVARIFHCAWSHLSGHAPRSVSKPSRNTCFMVHDYDGANEEKNGALPSPLDRFVASPISNQMRQALEARATCRGICARSISSRQLTSPRVYASQNGHNEDMFCIMEAFSE